MNNLTLLTPTTWTEYELLDSGDGEKLERYGQVTIARPDPQIIWRKKLPAATWKAADATFQRTTADKGIWKTQGKELGEWPVKWQELTFMARLSPFKHTGIFPEQAAHWDWMRKLLQASPTTATGEQRKVLNLFAYTGGASIVCSRAGAKVTHVDASRASIGWAKANQAASGLPSDGIRWILDDVMKFVSREARRGSKYDAIIMDPPVYGHGPTGETWDFKTSFPELLQLCQQILSDDPLFILINAYAVSTSAVTLGNVMAELMDGRAGQTTIGELALAETSSIRLLSTGIFARWEMKNKVL
ncbi:MAG: class I SAM-dependent methyltransferase [bacterium]|nr:class I SAM-dependent methyltransferase [bacterium]